MSGSSEGTLAVSSSVGFAPGDMLAMSMSPRWTVLGIKVAFRPRRFPWVFVWIRTPPSDYFRVKAVESTTQMTIAKD